MAVICKKCRQQYDITMFEFGRILRCDCGNIIDLNINRRNKKDKTKVRKLKEIIEEMFKKKGWYEILS